MIEGGTATNVVAERCRVEAEVRAIETKRVDQVVTERRRSLQDAADHAACDLDVAVERLFQGYRLRPSDPAVELAGRALRAIGHEPRPIVSGRRLRRQRPARGRLPVRQPRRTGPSHTHEPIESVSADALQTAALAFALREAPAARPRRMAAMLAFACGRARARSSAVSGLGTID